MDLKTKNKQEAKTKKKYLEKKEQEKIRKWLLDKMERGYRMGKIKIKHRSELYDRK